MGQAEIVVVGLLVAVVGLSALARRLSLPYPIVLVLGGALLGFVPGLPEVRLDAEVVLLLFLPPLLYGSSIFANFNDFRGDLRWLALNTAGLVLATMAVVAWVAHALIPGLPWAAAFVLGAIVSPTDPLAAATIMRRLGVPRRLVSAVEGEGLCNDATALVAYRVAVASSCQAASATLPDRGKQTDRVSMSASTLFPEPTTPSTGPLANLEPHVVWLQQSPQPEAAAARRRVNAWYQDFPDLDGQLAAKLTSTDNEVYYVALDELYVHQVLRRLEPDVRYEEGGQGPDFRVYRDGRQVLAVEVLSLFLRPEWARQARRHHELTDRLNKTFRPQGYFLHVEVLVRDPSRNLPLKALTRAAGAFLEELPEPQEVTAAYERGQPLPWRDVEGDGSYVRFEALPMRPNAAALADPDARIVGMGPAIGGPVDSHQRLRERLNAKRKKPYVLDPSVPYVLAVGNHDPFCNDLQLLMAIYGRDWEALIGGREPLWQDELKFRGFFGIDKGEPRYNTRFSAAAVINGSVLFHHPSTMEWLVFDNAHARVRLPAGLLPTTHRFQALDVSRWGWRPPRPLP